MRAEGGDGEAEGAPTAASTSPAPDSGPVGVDGGCPEPAVPQQERPSGVGQPPPAMMPGVSPRPATGGGRGRERGLGRAPHAVMSPMAVSPGAGHLAGGEFRANRRMPRDPATNVRICFDFCRGACPRPLGTCRYAHVVPPPHVYQSLQVMGAFGDGAGGGAGGQLPPPSPLLQHHLQQLSRCVLSRFPPFGRARVGVVGAWERAPKCPRCDRGFRCVSIKPPTPSQARARREPWLSAAPGGSARAFTSFADMPPGPWRNN